ncbi:TIGR00266 family protein [Leptolyngbya sp. FACHB-261]|uniref:TIGR00266 family protein n=1 Tax=Leptolyngbya sp. FACHB-261 TaxID=2692806 RepID=UPI0016848F07|nr:TIGR00266 family protein [Leptolyngbya sp. FACHB-261]MBD2102457.1 TIGR00266 family protein [Leptolyngbya sp. FACHB-261]
MKTEIRYKPAFATIFVTLGPGEKITAEASAMVSMSTGIEMTTQFSGGVLSALLRRLLGGESLFLNTFANLSSAPQQVVLTQSTPGDIMFINLQGNQLCLQPGAYIAHEPGVNLSIRWAGFASWISGEGLFKQVVSGNGRVFFGSYGGLTEKTVVGEYVVDTNHLVAYEPQLNLQVGLSSSLFGSFFSGEGLVNRIMGNGKIVLQSRSMDSLVKFLYPKVR